MFYDFHFNLSLRALFKKVLNVFISYWVLIVQCWVKSGMYMTPFWKKLFEILAGIFYIVSFYKYFLLTCQTFCLFRLFLSLLFFYLLDLSVSDKNVLKLLFWLGISHWLLWIPSGFTKYVLRLLDLFHIFW